MNFKRLKNEIKEMLSEIKVKQSRKCIQCKELQLWLKVLKKLVILQVKSLQKNLQPLVKYYFLQIQTKQKNLKIYELWLDKAPIRLIAYLPELSRKSLWIALKKLAKILFPMSYAFVKQIGGDNTIVKLYESKFGKRKYNKGHHIESAWGLGIIKKPAKKNQICYCRQQY